MPRLFTGLELPVEICADLALLRGGIANARWLAKEDYHITLRFIGDIDDRVAGEVADTLGEIQRPDFQVTIEALGWFGADKPRAIVALVKPTEALLELQADHERRMRRIGLKPETRKFTPHVTLARLRSASPFAVADYLSARGYFRSRAFDAKGFVLYSARDSIGGGPYLVEASYSLQQSDGPGR